MGKTLAEIAQQLKMETKKVQLIYAFNGTGKTRLSKEFKKLVDFKNDLESENMELANKRIIYYNAFTEDLFYWDNDLENNTNLKLRIHPNSFTEWVFDDQGQDKNAITYFQNYTNQALTPKFNSDFSEITFSFERGNEEENQNIKISKGEESCFVWSIFYSLLQQIINVLNELDPIDRETDIFDKLEYIFIDDPVTSLDDNHLIQLAVDLAETIKESKSDLKFIITTHNPLFYNILYNEFGAKNGYMLNKNEDGSYSLDDKYGDSNKNFSYHHHLIKVIKEAIERNKVEKYHFTLLRNLYEKTANFLGYKKWWELLPDDKEVYVKRIMNFYSHRTLLNEEVREPTESEKKTVELLLNHLLTNSRFWKEK